MKCTFIGKASLFAFATMICLVFTNCGTKSKSGNNLDTTSSNSESSSNQPIGSGPGVGLPQGDGNLEDGFDSLNTSLENYPTENSQQVEAVGQIRALVSTLGQLYGRLGHQNMTIQQLVQWQQDRERAAQEAIDAANAAHSAELDALAAIAKRQANVRDMFTFWSTTNGKLRQVHFHDIPPIATFLATNGYVYIDRYFSLYKQPQPLKEGTANQMWYHCMVVDNTPNRKDYFFISNQSNCEGFTVVGPAGYASHAANEFSFQEPWYRHSLVDNVFITFLSIYKNHPGTIGGVLGFPGF